jgi:hypothetical protein
MSADVFQKAIEQSSFGAARIAAGDFFGAASVFESLASTIRAHGVTQALRQSGGDLYLIWSNEHSAWWKPSSAGYTNDIDAAGRYSRVEALRICQNASYGTSRLSVPPEVPVREADAIITSEQATRG